MVNPKILMDSATVLFQHDVDLVRQFRSEFYFEDSTRGLDSGVNNTNPRNWHKASIMVVGTE